MSYLSLAAILRNMMAEHHLAHAQLVQIRQLCIAAAQANGLDPAVVALDVREMLEEGYSVSSILDKGLHYGSDNQG